MHSSIGCEAPQALAVCAQGRTDSGHLYVMDPTDILSTGGRGFGLSPMPSGVIEAGGAGAPLQQPRMSAHLRALFRLGIGLLELDFLHVYG